MKKIYLILTFSSIFFIFLTGCTIKTDYIEKYNDKLHIIFGDFRYEYLGNDFFSGYENIRDYYKKWRIYYKDAYGKEKNVILTNNQSFDSQIKNIYNDVIERYLMVEVLNEYLDGKYYDNYREIYDENTIAESSSIHYYTKKYDYEVYRGNSLSFQFDYNGFYDSKKDKIKDYHFFNLTDTKIEDLINNGNIKIAYIIYHPQNEDVLSDKERQEQIDYLVDITQKINNIIPVENAYYYLQENIITYEGKPSVSSKRYTLNFKK